MPGLGHGFGVINMSFLTKLFSNVGGGIIESIGNVADKFNLSGEEKQQFQLDMETLIQKRDAKLQDSLQIELQAKERVIVAELTQGDTFTKRARPTVVYFGLVVIFINHVLGPWLAVAFGNEIPEINLPTEFWAAWGGIVATWSIGRSFEKTGKSNKVTQAVTGSRSVFD